VSAPIHTSRTTLPLPTQFQPPRASPVRNMHSPRSINLIYRFRFAAVMWCARVCLLSASFVLMLGGVCVYDPYLTYVGAGAGISGGFMAILQWMIASKARCPLCQTPILADKACSRHRQAKSAFGSHRTRVALSIIFKNQFYCPYCNEPTLLRLKNSVK
jgi:hypothetical protein